MDGSYEWLPQLWILQRIFPDSVASVFVFYLISRGGCGELSEPRSFRV